MKNITYPLIPWKYTTFHGGYTFLVYAKSVSVTAPKKLLNNLITLCDGDTLLEEVVQKIAVEWNKELVLELIEVLTKEKVIIDVTESPALILKTTLEVNPPLLNMSYSDITRFSIQRLQELQKTIVSVDGTKPADTYLSKLLRARKSTRDITKGMTLDEMVNVLWSAYGVTSSQELEECTTYSRTVGSAGGLYPLNLYIALNETIGIFLPGIYRVGFGITGIGLTFQSNFSEKFYQSFKDPILAFSGSALVFVCGDTSLQTPKYGNKTPHFLSIETGMVCQNIHLSAIENDLATVQFGGYEHDLLKDALELDDTQFILGVVILGKTASDKAISIQNVTFNFLERKISDNFILPFSLVTSHLSHDVSMISSGKDIDPLLAIKKSVSEMIEWNSCSSGRLLSMQYDKDLCLDPRTIQAFTSMQYDEQSFPLHVFDENQMYEWISAQNLKTHEQKNILADLVQYPYISNTRYAFANSSGCAAHPIKERAIEHAIHELVERDAFMVGWLNKITPSTLAEPMIPDYCKKARNMLSLQGFKTLFKFYNFGIAPVAVVIIENQIGFQTIATACKNLFSEALCVALDEALTSVYFWYHRGNSSESIQPEDVHNPQDHEVLYRQKKYRAMSDFLSQETKPMFLEGNYPQATEVLYKKGYNIWLIDRSVSQREIQRFEDLYVVQCIVPGLVPITFDYHCEPCGLDRIYSAPIESGYLSEKNSFSNLNRFPHPFN